MNQAIKLIAIGVIAASLLGLCLVVGGVGIYVALAGNSQAAVWDPVVAEKDRLRQEMYDDFQALQAKHKGPIPSRERTAFIQRANELDNRINKMMFADPQLRGKMPPSVGEKFGGPLMTEAMHAMATAPREAHPQIEAAKIAAAQSRQEADQMIRRMEASGQREAERQAAAQQAMVAQKAEADRIWSEIEGYYAVPGDPGTRRQLINRQEAIIIKMREIERGLRTTYHPGDRFGMVMVEYQKLQQQMIEVEREEEERKRSAAVADAQLKQFELESAERRRKVEEDRAARGLLPRTGAYTIGPDGKLRPLASSGPTTSASPPVGNLPSEVPLAAPSVATNEPPAAVDPFAPPTTSDVPPAVPAIEPPNVEPMQPAAVALPGFAVEEIAQLHTGAKILVRNKEKWLPATILAKRNKLFDIRYAAGDVAVVTADRIRLQEDPVGQK